MSFMDETRKTNDESTEMGKPQITKRKTGTTTYEISLYFSKASAENVQDKLRWIIINNYVNGKKIDIREFYEKFSFQFKNNIL